MGVSLSLSRPFSSNWVASLTQYNLNLSVVPLEKDVHLTSSHRTRSTCHLLSTSAGVHLVQNLHLVFKISLNISIKQGNHWMSMHVSKECSHCSFLHRMIYIFLQTLYCLFLYLVCLTAFRLCLHWLLSSILFLFLSPFHVSSSVFQDKKGKTQSFIQHHLLFPITMLGLSD